MQSYLTDNVVLLKLDAEADELGREIARARNVTSYPTFILTNGDAETMDRWLGYGNVAEFVESTNERLADAMTLRARERRFGKEQTEADARKIGSIREASGYPAEAIAYFRRAAELATTTEHDYDAMIFESLSRGASRGLYTGTALFEQAQVVMAADPDARTIANVVMTMGRMAEDTDTQYVPFITRALEATRDDESLSRYHQHFQVEHALHVERNGDKAYELHVATMPEGWENTGSSLNSVAWWCFENGVKLEKAQELAKRGVELSPAGAERAMVLDTLAELCNALGNCGEAIEWIEKAIADDPDNEYYAEQLERFQKILTDQG